MSVIVEGRVVLQGSADQRIRDLSLHLLRQVDFLRWDYLFELCNEDGVRWSIFVSHGRVPKVQNPDRVRKIVTSGLTLPEAHWRIREEVFKRCPNYQVVEPPVWWPVGES